MSVKIIETATYIQVISKLQELYDGYGTAKEYQRGLLIVGASGTGKSLMFSAFASRFPPIETEERIIRPVIHVVIDDPRIDSVLQTLLAAFGMPAFYSKKPKEMMDAVLRCIENSQTRLILIDEASQVAEHRGDKTVRKCADFFKTIINKTKAAVALGGVDSLLLLRDSNQQFRDRFPSIRTHVWGVSKKETRKAFVAYTYDYAKYRNITIPKTKAGIRLVQAMLYATDGRPRNINGLIDLAAKLYPDSNGADLQHIFMKAFEGFASCASNARNPFHASFNGRELTGHGELYAPETIKF